MNGIEDIDLHGHAEDGAHRQLDAIRSGGKHLVMVVRQRIAAGLDELDKGDFGEAQDKLAAATGMLGTLANAQRYIAIADGSRFIKATELEVGMELTQVGAITNVEIEECPVPACRRHVKVEIGEHKLQFHGDTEVYVVN